MTRINADLAPALLTDQHLFAEYREMRRIPKALLKSLAAQPASALQAQIPANFKLGSGHVKFFYDKGRFLIERHVLLRRELIERGYRLSDDGVFDNLGVYARHPEFLGASLPLFSRAERALVIARILERIGERPQLYTLRKTRIELVSYAALLASSLGEDANALPIV